MARYDAGYFERRRAVIDIMEWLDIFYSIKAIVGRPRNMRIVELCVREGHPIRFLHSHFPDDEYIGVGPEKGKPETLLHTGLPSYVNLRARDRPVILSYKPSNSKKTYLLSHELALSVLRRSLRLYVVIGR